MKNIMIAMVMVLLCHTNINAQKIGADKVPASVRDAFKTKFPTASSATWEIEKKDVYEVNFAIGKQKQAAQFDKAGKWEKTEVEIETSQLPKAVAESFAKAYPGYKIKESEKVETATNKELYELEAAKGNDKIEVQLLPTGEIMKRETISSKD